MYEDMNTKEEDRKIEQMDVNLAGEIEEAIGNTAND